MPGAEREADYTGTHGMFQQTALTVLYRDDDSGYVTICVCQSSENCTPCRENLACVLARSLHSCPTLYDPMDCPCQIPVSKGFSRQGYWSGLPFSPPGDLPDSGIEPASLKSPVLAGGFFNISTTWPQVFFSIALVTFFPSSICYLLIMAVVDCLPSFDRILTPNGRGHLYFCSWMYPKLSEYTWHSKGNQ